MKNFRKARKARKVKHEQEASFIIDLDEVEDRIDKQNSLIKKWRSNNKFKKE